MTDGNQSQILPLLIEISKLDVRVAGLSAHQKQLEEEHKSRTQAVGAVAHKRDARLKLLNDKRALCAREEKGVKLEREKINDRRRALGTLNNYKLQQAAEREIDYVSKQIGQREDLLLGLMREIEVIEKEMTEVDAVLKGMLDELNAFEAKARESITEIQAELKQLSADRVAKAKEIGNPQHLTLYNRVIARFPSDPIVDVVNRESCAGCFMKVGPQVAVQISRGDVVKCPGCGRILKLPQE